MSLTRMRRLGVLGINRRNTTYTLGWNPRSQLPMVDDKLATKRLCREAGIPVPELLSRAVGASWLILVNADDLYIENEEIKTYEPEERESCHVFYTQEYMQSLFPRAAVLAPVNNEMQHCCTIRASVCR